MALPVLRHALALLFDDQQSHFEEIEMAESRAAALIK